MLDRSALIHDIRALMRAPLDGAKAPALAQVERTLTDGYAHALALESDRLQLERRLALVAGELGTDPSAFVREITSLTQQLRDTDFDLIELRELLDSLRRRASALRSRAA
jgi:hypothetical protein